MGIHFHLDDSAVFEPEILQAMSEAFDATCNSLHVFSGDAAGRRIIATRIIDLGRARMTLHN